MFKTRPDDDDEYVEPSFWESGMPIGNDLKPKVPTAAYAGDVAAKYGDTKTAIQSGNLGASIRSVMADSTARAPKPKRKTFGQRIGQRD